jgi:uncharacterized protein (UPF0335 family)
MSVDANQIATKGDLQALLLKLEQLLDAQPPTAAAGDDYLDIDQVATLTGFNRKTVRKWIAEGKYDQRGKRIKLFTLEFAPGFPRIPRSALLAFGKGIGFEVSHLASPPGMRLAS